MKTGTQTDGSKRSFRHVYVNLRQAMLLLLALFAIHQGMAQSVDARALNTRFVFPFVMEIIIHEAEIDHPLLTHKEAEAPAMSVFDPDVCYLVSDGAATSDDSDTLYTFNHLTAAVTPIGPTGTYHIEAIAIDTVNGILYATDADDFGTLNLSTGAFTAINSNIGNVDGSEGSYNISDLDGLTFDYSTNTIWATERRNSGSNGQPDDLLIKINPITGQPIPDVFGSGVDYVVIATNEHDLDDIAIAPDGTLYAISNYGGSGNQRLGTINKTNGAWTEIGDYGIQDVESLMYTANGQMLATTGKDGNQPDGMYSIDAATAIATFVGNLEPAHDVEGCECINGVFSNLQLGDKVWADNDSDGIQDSGEPGIQGVIVNLLDSNGNPVLDGGSPITTTTDASGNYLFDGISDGSYIVEFVKPSGKNFTQQFAGSDSAIDSDAGASNGWSNVISLGNSTNNYTIDAGLIDASAPEECTEIPTLDLQNPTLISGSSGQVGSSYRFSNVVAGTDAILTVLSMTHSDIVIYSIDEPSSTFGGYDQAFQPIIDYNWLNSDNSYDPPGDKSVTFRIDFVDTGTSNLTNVFEVAMTAIDVDGSAQTDEVKEFFETSGYQSYATQSTTSLTLSGALKAQGPITNYANVDETALDVMIEFDYANASSITFTYGANYGGSTTMSDSGIGNSDEARHNSLFFKCYTFDTENCEPVNPPIATNASRCGTGTVTLTASGCDGTIHWYDSATGGNLLYSGSSFTTPDISVTTTYYAACEVVDCFSATRTPATATIDPIPTVSITGPSNLCIGQTSTVSPTTGGTWTSSDESVAIISNSGLVTAVGAGQANFTFTDNATSCSSSATSDITVNPLVSASVDFNGSVCLEDNSQLSAISTGGTPGYTYNWTGPNGFTSTNQTVNIVDDGNYFLTITDAVGCEGTTSAFVYERYEPFIFALNTEVCEGDDVTLSVNSASAVSYQWGPNAGNATSSSMTVTPAPPSTTYMVTVTNDVGCSTTATAVIDVLPNPTVSVTGPSSICEGFTTTLSPTTGGVWTSNNPSIATVTNSGVVTGISAGTASFIFTDNLTSCTSDPTTGITVLPKPLVNVSGPTAICEGETTNLSPSTGGIWSSSNPSIATVTNSGVVTGISAGVVNFTFTSNATNCPSDATEDITINEKPDVNITGPTTICVGSYTYVSPTSGGTWTSSNPSVAIIANDGMITGVAEGSANFTFTNSSTGCVSDATASITVDQKTPKTITGDMEMCEGDVITLTINGGGGMWISSDPSVATINNLGVVTAVSVGNVIITYDHPASSCDADATHPIQVHATPIVSVLGPNNICTGETTSLSPTSGGTWTSSDNNIATVSNSGVVTGLNQGTVSFTFTNSTTGCVSNATSTITVNPAVSVIIDFNGSICINDNSQLSAIVSGGTANFSYSWMGPNGFTATGQTVSITDNGNYSVTVSDAAGCSASTTAFVYERYDPFIFTLNTDICEGESVSLSVNSSSAVSYQWSANAGNATTQSITVYPSPPSSTYFVTVTNDIGCSTEASATITVEPKPTVSVTGSTTICEGETTTLSPSSGGTWSSSNTSVATVTNSGIVTGVGAGSASFTFTDSSTGCVSDPTLNVAVNNNGTIIINGDPNICIDENPTFTASVVGGIWSSSNTSVATINSSGVVTPLGPGNAIISYDANSSSCFNEANYPIQVYTDPNITLTGPSMICEGETTSLSPASGGIWTSSDSSIAVITNSGIVTGISAGNVYFTFTSSTSGCNGQTQSPVTIVENPDIGLLGPPEICIGGTTDLSPTSGGIWTSSDNAIASVSNSGVVTGKAAGTATFMFTEFTNGCTSDSNISILVHPDDAPTFTGPQELCIGETTSILPASGGVWTSSDPSVASITNTGNITGIAPGMASFTYTNLTTGCISDASGPLSVNNKPIISLTGPSNICAGSFSTMSPSSGGTWQSSDNTVATINNQGMITGVSAGTVQFIFTSSSTGCKSDSSVVVTVDPPTPISLTGPSIICVGEMTTFAPTSGGTWISSNNAIATISNMGVVTGVSAGTVTFIFNSFTSCPSDASQPITIEPKPNVTYTGPSSICVGITTTLSPSTGGVWTSSDPGVATVTNAGLVTGVSLGSATFTFVDGNTGCSATTQTSLTVYSKPTVTITGANQICVGENSSLTPTSGGTWTSSDPSVASISSTGVVTGISAGTATFTFTESGSLCSSDPSDPITVLAKPVISISGSNMICVDETTVMSPSSGGVWTSNNPSVATITNGGIVTGISQGIVQFTFISDAGCASNPSSPIVIFGKPEVIINGPTNICIGSTMNISPGSGGTWTSSNPSVATVDNNGLITAITPGVVSFTFTDTGTGCVSDASEDITVTDIPDANILGPDQICIGFTTTLTPTTGGVWTSSDPSIATVQNDGTVTGIASGTATFTFMETASGCISDPTGQVTVNSLADPVFVGDSVLCIGESTTLIPSTGGTWTSTNSTVATITNSGVVTAISQGTARFRFTLLANGCSTDLSSPLIVNGDPVVSVSGPSAVCIGGSTNLSPSSGGVWTSSNPAIATVDNSGQVIGISSGTVYFTFTDGNTNCSSDGNLSIDVEEKPIAQFSGDMDICVGYKTTLSPTTGGIWISNNLDIATVSNDGVVTGVAPGKVTFQFLDASTGCLSDATADSLSVSDCLNPDFNVTTSLLQVSGNVSTNDLLPAGAIYSTTPILISKPSGSIPTITSNVDGSYSFVSEMPGKYQYNISACLPPYYTGCPNVMLEITVSGDVIATNNPIANLEFATTYAGPDAVTPGQTIIIDALANDACIITSYCDLDPASLSISNAPGNGIASVLPNGKISYTPDAGFIGFDTISYSICVDGDLSNCSITNQFITVKDLTAVNTIDAADDFVWTMKETSVSGNVWDNDSDPETDNLAITALGSAGSPMVMPQGSYFIDPSGDFTFIPTTGFAGPAEIVYTVCDDSANPNCQNATIHILVFESLSLDIRVYLEGALMDNGGETGLTSGRPLMRDNLRNSPFTGENYIPLIDPYSNPIGFIDITPYYKHYGPGLLADNRIITDSLGVFSVTGENAIVDWIFVELRSKTNNSLPIATRSGLLQRDGDIVDLDGVSPLQFSGINQDSFYVKVKHRNHLGAMSKLIAKDELIDFTTNALPVFDFGTSLGDGFDYTGLAMKNGVVNNYRCLWAGDFDSNGKIKFVNPNDDQNILFFEVLLHPGNEASSANYDYGYGYLLGDYNMNSKAKYTNPDDDRNLIFSQVLLYPLNYQFLSNFNFFIEQIPD